jgi:hypothetical protein
MNLTDFVPRAGIAGAQGAAVLVAQPEAAEWSVRPVAETQARNASKPET